jgi:hypothetical protein
LHSAIEFTNGASCILLQEGDSYSRIYKPSRGFLVQEGLRVALIWENNSSVILIWCDVVKVLYYMLADTSVIY